MDYGCRYEPDEITESEHKAQLDERLKIRDRWVGRPCYLDDQKAAIVDGQFGYALVVAKEKTIKATWQTVNKVMYGKMCFVSGQHGPVVRTEAA